MLASIVLLLIPASTQGPAIDATQFSKILQGLYADVKDVSFLYESQIRFIGPGPTPAFSGMDYDGIYAYRSDGATLLDAYSQRTGDAGTPFYQVTAMLGDKTEIAERGVDQDALHVQRYGRVIGVLNSPGSPERIVHLWFLQQVMHEPAAWGYTFEGWEDVDGHRCLRVRFEQVKGSTVAEKPYLRFWIDVERGGHALRVDMLRGEHLLGRMLNIKLKQVPTEDGKTVWFPSTGEDESFLVGAGEYSDRPTFRDTCTIVEGTLQINRGLKDSQFSVNWKGGMPDSDRLRELRGQFVALDQTKKPQASEIVQKRLERTLGRADARTERLVASSPARARWNITLTLQVVVGLIAAMLLVGAWVVRRRLG